jgi:glutamine---fructose-6-phosphate transaminase (isomerizing)
MCGIVAYKGKKECSDILLNCIKNLEYRGYDSIGIATKNKNNITIKKDIGKIKQVDNKVNFHKLKGNMGIAHTRWATNGGVTKENSHPHFSNDKKVYIVHNGIIENHQDLRKELELDGINCHSETDSEVIAQLFSKYINKGISVLKAFKITLKKLKGSYAITAIINTNESIFFARNESPLVIGIKDDNNKDVTTKNNNNIHNLNHNINEKNNFKNKEFFLASDVPAFLNHTNKIIYIEDYEYGYIDDNKIKIYNLNSNIEKEKKIQNIKWNVEQAKKGIYPHFMIKEINDQKETIINSIKQQPKTINKAINMLKNAYGIFFVGCGTSYHAGISVAYTFAHIAKKHVNVVIASEFRNYEEFLTDKTIVVAISQSGETADLLDAVKTAKKKGSKILSIVNVMGSTLMRLSNHTILMNAGPEICVLSTKSYTSQLSILLLLAYGLINKIDQGKELIKKSAKEVEYIIQNNNEKINKIAEKIKNSNSLFLIGRDLAYPSAIEGALKIKEVTYIHAEGFAGGELKHGTIALIDKKTPCICLTTNTTRNMILSNASEIKARGGFIIGIDSRNNEIYDEFIKVKELGHANPITMIIPIQLLSYYLALKRKCDPDKPRNLAKSVTVK